MRSSAMPELPEVEIAARHLRRWGVGRKVVAVEADDTRVLRPDRAASLRPLVGKRLVEVRRVGKNLLLAFAGGRGERVGAWSHLGMTGKWLLRDRGDEPPRWSRLRLALDDGRVLHYGDLRLFGRFRVVPGARFEELPELRGLGPDPLDEGIDVARLAERLGKAKRPIKVALLDQALIPGVGNIQASEALFRARIDPRREARSLTAAEVRRLADGVLSSVRETVARMEEDERREPGRDLAYVEEPGAPNPFAVYERAGERCPRCRKATIERVVLGGRSTYFCPRCQK